MLTTHLYTKHDEGPHQDAGPEESALVRIRSGHLRQAVGCGRGHKAHGHLVQFFIPITGAIEGGSRACSCHTGCLLGNRKPVSSLGANGVAGIAYQLYLELRARPCAPCTMIAPQVLPISPL